MPINLSIKNAPDAVVATLKLRAKQNHRSLQGELLAIIEQAAGATAPSNLISSPHDISPVKWDAQGPGAEVQKNENIERVVRLMRDGVHLGGRRFSRDEMHER